MNRWVYILIIQLITIFDDVMSTTNKNNIRLEALSSRSCTILFLSKALIDWHCTVRMSIINSTTAIHYRYIARAVSPPLSSHITEDRFLSHRSVPKPLSPSSHNPIYRIPVQLFFFLFLQSWLSHRWRQFCSPHGHNGLNKLLVKLKTLIVLSYKRIPPGSILLMD